MKTDQFDSMSTTSLVAAYVDLSMREEDATDRGAIARVRKLFAKRMKIENVLRSRGIAARRALMPLLKHPSAQVRLDAAKHLFAIAPTESRATLEDIAAHGPSQQRGAAGMCLWYIEEGIFKPT